MGKDDVWGCRSLRWETPPSRMDLSPVWEAAVSVTEARTAVENTLLSQISGGGQRQVQKLTQDPPPPQVSCCLPTMPPVDPPPPLGQLLPSHHAPCGHGTGVDSLFP